MNRTKINNKLEPCEICGIKLATQEHHLFSQSKINRKTYGDLIDKPFNKMKVCEGCHLWKSIPKFTEKEFREEAKKQGYKLPKGSKSYQTQWGEE